ncbi:MAG TPA: MmcQ/YjbR family DNA-binding protein [Clostridia bacterium]|nr:MmcQ/YjbR family DNA-binding protein [Clostridia bacterium]
MTTDEIIQYCLSKTGAYVDFPFGDIPMCIKVSNRLFAQIYPKPEDHKLTLNCDRAAGEFYRSEYPGTVVRGYHCPPAQQPYFNTVYLDKGIPDEKLKDMIDHSYSTVVGKLPKRQKEALLSGRSTDI